MFDTTNETVETPEVETENSEFMEGFMDSEPEADDAETYAAEDAETTEESEPDVEVSDTIPYTYNHTTTQLPRAHVAEVAKALNVDADTLVSMLQKGNNYDTLSQRQEPYFPLIRKINDYAKENGMDSNAAIEKIMGAFDIVANEKYARDLRRQYPGAAPDLLNEVAKSRAEAARQQNRLDAERKEAEAAESERKEKWVGFFKAHPDVTSESLSERMLQALANHEDPELVYAQEQNSLLSKQNSELLQKQSNASRSPGSARKTSGGKPTSDFMAGFWGK